MPPYTFLTQVKIVIATMAIHNFIVEQRLQDEVLDETQQMNTLNNNTNENEGEEHGTADELEICRGRLWRICRLTVFFALQFTSCYLLFYFSVSF